MKIGETVLNNVKCLPINIGHKVDLFYGIDIASELPTMLKLRTFDKIFFITEEFIHNLHGCRLVEIMRDAGIDCEVVIISGDEKNKTFSNLEYVCNLLIEKNVSKDSIIIGFGGGLTGNIAGMAAALIYRGIRFIEMPTTLMGQSDSSLSNKQAINGKTGKNQFGTYYAPEFIWADIQYLATESPRHLKAAIIEGIKNAFISNESLLDDFERILYKKDKFTVNDIFEIYELIIQSKNVILEKDPSEKKYAIILEYGHTFGHAIEFLTNGRIIHGEAVASGMCIAAELGYMLGLTTEEVLNRHYHMFRDVMGLQLKLPEELTAQKIFETIQRDNKRVFSGIKYIVLDKVGKCMNPDGDYQVSVKPEIVIQAIQKYIGKYNVNVGETMSISWLVERMRSYSNREAVIYNYISFTYNQILECYDKWINIIESTGIKQGEVVGVEGDYSPETCAAILVLIQNRNIIIPLSSAVINQKEEFLTIAEADKLLVITDDGYKLFKYDHQKDNELIKKLNAINSPGLILFTSGSTGTPKGVLHDFSKLLEKYKVKRDALRTLTFLLFDHIGGVNTLFHALSNGGTVITSKSRKPEDICKIIEKYKVELLPASPTFLNILLLSEQYKWYDLSSLKIISYGTEVMPESVLKKLNQVFPGVQIRQTYGLSEIGIMRAKSKGSDSLWVKIGGEGFQTKIVDGILFIKAESAMLGYLNADSPFDEDGWFNTQDQVLVEGEYVKILGRKTELINVAGQKVYPAEIEEVILQMPGVKDVVVKGERNIIMGNIVVAKVNLIQKEDLGEFKDRLQEYCKDKMEPFKIPVKVEISDDELFNARFKRIRK